GVAVPVRRQAVARHRAIGDAGGKLTGAGEGAVQAGFTAFYHLTRFVDVEAVLGRAVTPELVVAFETEADAIDQRVTTGARGLLGVLPEALTSRGRGIKLRRNWVQVRRRRSEERRVGKECRS